MVVLNQDGATALHLLLRHARTGRPRKNEKRVLCATLISSAYGKSLLPHKGRRMMKSQCSRRRFVLLLLCTAGIGLLLPATGAPGQ